MVNVSVGHLISMQSCQAITKVFNVTLMLIGVPMPMYTWYKDGTPLPEASLGSSNPAFRNSSFVFSRSTGNLVFTVSLNYKSNECFFFLLKIEDV